MVIGSLFFRRRVAPAFVIAPALILSLLRLVADDQIIKTDGTTINGTIVGVDGGQVTVESHTSNGGIAKVPYYISDIKSISMTVPAEVTKVQAPGTAPGVVIAALEPQVQQFAGLPASWIVNAMAQLGDAYSQVGQMDKALAVYNKISELYPGSPYENVAKASKAEVSLNAGKIDEALAIVQPIVDAANKNIAPSPKDGETFAKAFLVYGRVLEAQKKPQQALEAYLTVKTMFYQNPNLVAEAEHYSKDLRDHNPGIGID
jgi:tetratricopeptide (TPR) repeat protein